MASLQKQALKEIIGGGITGWWGMLAKFSIE